MWDGAIVHLTEDGMQKLKVPDDHVVMHMYASNISKEVDMFFMWKKFWNIRGILFSWS